MRNIVFITTEHRNAKYRFSIIIYWVVTESSQNFSLQRSLQCRHFGCPCSWLLTQLLKSYWLIDWLIDDWMRSESRSDTLCWRSSVRQRHLASTFTLWLPVLLMSTSGQNAARLVSRSLRLATSHVITWSTTSRTWLLCTLERSQPPTVSLHQPVAPLCDQQPPLTYTASTPQHLCRSVHVFISRKLFFTPEIFVCFTTSSQYQLMTYSWKLSSWSYWVTIHSHTLLYSILCYSKFSFVLSFYSWLYQIHVSTDY